MGWGLGSSHGRQAGLSRAAVRQFGGGRNLGMSSGRSVHSKLSINIPIVVYLLNNSLLGLNRQQQNMFYNKRWISTDLHYNNPTAGHYRGIDFVATAKGMGMCAELIQDPSEIGSALERAFSANKPYLIELTIDPNAMCSVSGDGTLDGIIENI